MHARLNLNTITVQSHKGMLRVLRQFQSKHKKCAVTVTACTAGLQSEPEYQLLDSIKQQGELIQHRSEE